MKNIIGIIVLIIIALAGFYFFQGSDSGPSEEGPIKIGVSIPLSGEIASYGEFTKAGIDLAVKEVNDAGGINGRLVKAVYEDDACTSDGSSVFNKLVNIDQVHAIIGPVCSSAAGPAIPIAQEAGVPTIIWASAPGLPSTGDYIFRTYPSDAFQGKFAAEYVYDTLGKRKVAILYVKNDWGQGIKDVFTGRFTELGGTITIVEGASQDSIDLRTELTKVVASDPDLIYIPLFTAGAVSVVQQASARGVDVPFFGGDILDAVEFTSVPEADGIQFTYGKLNSSNDFTAKVREVTGKESNIFTGVAYDSMKILASVMTEVGTDPEKVRDALVELSYTDGVSLPLISFDSDGDLASAQVEVRIVKDGKSEVVE